MRLLGTQRITTYPWYADTHIDYQVEVWVMHFEADENGQAQLSAVWTILDGGGHVLGEQPVERQRSRSGRRHGGVSGAQPGLGPDEQSDCQSHRAAQRRRAAPDAGGGLRTLPGYELTDFGTKKGRGTESGATEQDGKGAAFYGLVAFADLLIDRVARHHYHQIRVFVFDHRWQPRREVGVRPGARSSKSSSRSWASASLSNPLLDDYVAGGTGTVPTTGVLQSDTMPKQHIQYRTWFTVVLKRRLGGTELDYPIGLAAFENYSATLPSSLYPLKPVRAGSAQSPARPSKPSIAYSILVQRRPRNGVKSG